MLNSSETITISSTLTKVGRKRLTEGRFDISKVAFSDDGVNYSLINQNLSDDDILVKRSPMFDVWKDGHLGMKNKVRIDYSPDVKPNTFDSININISESNIFSNSGEEKFPSVSKDGNFKLIFNGYTPQEINTPSLSEIRIDYNGEEPKFYAVTLYDYSYFDIALSPNSIDKYLELYNINNISDTKLNQLSKIDKNADMITALKESQPQGIIQKDLLDHNYLSSLFLEPDVNDRISKTITVGATNTGAETNAFSLYYRGNFDYENAGTQKYKSYLEILDTDTGATKLIELIINIK